MRKTCTRCGETKPLDAFSPKNTRCKACRNAQHRERYASDAEYAERTRDRLRTRQRARYASDPEFAERRRAYHRAYMNARYASDPEFAERARVYSRERYDGLTGWEYNRVLLKQRRREALKRRQQRLTKED